MRIGLRLASRSAPPVSVFGIGAYWAKPVLIIKTCVQSPHHDCSGSSFPTLPELHCKVTRRDSGRCNGNMARAKTFARICAFVGKITWVHQARVSKHFAKPVFGQCYNRLETPAFLVVQTRNGCNNGPFAVQRFPKVELRYAEMFG